MMIVALGAVLLTTGQVLMESNLKPNVQKLINRDYAAMSFRDYYAIGVLDQVQQYIRENYGEEPEEYRVVSLGIDPAAALYHGFYCLDGYSNNYDLNYKHRFRRIIAPELNKSEYLADNFDHWGNRCYLFSAECPGITPLKRADFIFRITKSTRRVWQSWEDGIFCPQLILIIARIRDLNFCGRMPLRRRTAITAFICIV